ncbi:hypothetical protein Bca52824_035548 [Brassica carinata]|uniref:RNase H type-1 domain-containing protein n=1 Tax=Brassica carinata TaxID=52824 RepID=A0A8X7V464_BRACI|nr:hypothetical protein Bca52824_035548 [Brassica carinata]
MRIKSDSSSLAPQDLWIKKSGYLSSHEFTQQSLVTVPVSKRLPSVPSCWIDGAWQESSFAGGMGWIIKNSAEEVLCRGSSNRSHVSSALMAEALAMREALKKAQDLNSLQVFSNSQVLISTLCSGVGMNEIAGVLQDIKILSTLFCPLSFIFIPRTENSQADTLA